MKDFGDYVQNDLSAKMEHKELIEIEASNHDYFLAKLSLSLEVLDYV